MNGNNKTFAQLVESAFAKVLHEGAQSERINVVYDVYHQIYVKDAERLNQYVYTSLQYKNLAGGHHISSNGEFFCAIPPTKQVSLSF